MAGVTVGTISTSTLRIAKPPFRCWWARLTHKGAKSYRTSQVSRADALRQAVSAAIAAGLDVIVFEDEDLNQHFAAVLNKPQAVLKKSQSTPTIGSRRALPHDRKASGAQ